MAGMFKALFGKLRESAQQAVYRGEEHARYLDVLRAAVEDGIISDNEMMVIQKAKDDARGGITDARKMEVFNRMMAAIMEDRIVTTEEVESARFLVKTLELPRDVAEPAVESLERLVSARAIASGEFGEIDLEGVRLQKSEVVCVKMQAALVGIKKRRHYVGGSRGVSFRIAKGVSYRVGGFKGHSETSEEEVIEAYGSVFVTSKRVIFASLKKSFSVRFPKLINIDIYGDGVIMHSESRQKPYYLIFPNKDGELFSAALKWVDRQ